MSRRRCSRRLLDRWCGRLLGSSRQRRRLSLVKPIRAEKPEHVTVTSWREEDEDVIGPLAILAQLNEGHMGVPKLRLQPHHDRLLSRERARRVAQALEASPREHLDRTLLAARAVRHRAHGAKSALAEHGSKRPLGVRR